MTPSTAREKMLEEKVNTLEHRLQLVERFVEIRFCETFRDFSARNSSAPSSSQKKLEHVATNKGSRMSACPRSKMSRDNDKSAPSPAPSPPPSSSDDQSEDEEPTTSYRTRSGRKTTRLNAAALKGGGASKKTLKSSPSKSIKETPISNKVLRVNMSRLEDDRDKGNTESTKMDLGIVKVYEDTEGEDDAAGDDDHDYFTYPVNEASEDDYEGGEYGTEEGDGDDGDADEAGKDNADEDFKVGGSRKRKITPSSSKKPVGEKKKRIRKKYYVPSSLKLITTGVTLENINPDTNTKECPFCHEHWRVDLFDRHLENQHMKERHLQCSYCDKRFFVVNALHLHERSHQLDKYGSKCRLCDKVFPLPCKTLAHERVCIRQRLESDQSVDEEIMKDVRQRSKNVDLKWPNPNEVIPEGMKKCVHCRQLLKEEHMQAHLKEKHVNWKCTLCDKTYVEKSGLVRHLCNAHGNNKKTCDLCKQVFESRSAIRAHNSECQRLHRRRSNGGNAMNSEKLIEAIRAAKRESATQPGKVEVDLEPETSSSSAVVEQEENVSEEPPQNPETKEISFAAKEPEVEVEQNVSVPIVENELV